MENTAGVNKAVKCDIYFSAVSELRFGCTSNWVVSGLVVVARLNVHLEGEQCEIS